MRPLMLALVLAVAAPVTAQTALPPQWGTSSTAAPTPKQAPKEKKKLKVKPGEGAVAPPAQPAAPPQPTPAVPVTTGPAQTVSAPAPQLAAPAPAPAQAAPAQTLPAHAPTPAASPPPQSVAESHTAASRTKAPAKKKVAKAKPAPSSPAATTAPRPATVATSTAPPPSTSAPASPLPVAAPVAAASTPARTVASQPAASIPPAASSAPVATSPAPVAAPVATSPPPATAAAPVPQTVYAQPAATYAAPPPVYPTTPAGEPLPGAYVPPLPPTATPAQPLPSLTATPSHGRHKANRQAIAAEPTQPWIDISAPLSVGVTPAYPGTAPLAMRFDYDMERGAPLDLSEFSMSTHTGTHVDAPLHFLRGAPAIDQVPLEQLCGAALVLNVDPSIIAITAADLERYPWRGARRILFRTRNSVNAWIVDPLFHPDFTFLAPDAAELLANNGVLVVGIDYLSIEQFGAPPRTHVILLGKGIPIIEGLDLRNVAAGEYDLTVLPLKILGHEAAPARAVLRRR